MVHPQHRTASLDASKEMKDENGWLVSFYALATVLAYLLRFAAMLLALQVLPGCPPAQSGAFTAPMAAKIYKNLNWFVLYKFTEKSAYHLVWNRMTSVDGEG